MRLNLGSKPNWGLHVADQSLECFKSFNKKDKRKRVDLDLWNSPDGTLHPLSFIQKPETPLSSTHVIPNPRTHIVSAHEGWLLAELCGPWVIFSGNAHEHTVKNSSEGEGTQLLSWEVHFKGNGHCSRIRVPTPPQTFQICNYTTWYH